MTRSAQSPWASRWSPLRRAALTLSLSLAFAPSAHAQEEAEAQDAGVAPPRIVPYAASEIAGAVNTTTLSLEALEVTLEPSQRVRTIEASLPAMQERVRDRADTSTQGLGLRELDEARQTWLATQAELAEHQSTLEERAAGLEGLAHDLDDMRARWAATRDVEPPLPPAALEQVRRVIRQIAATRRLIDERLAKTLQVQRNVARVQLIATGVLAQIDNADARLRGQLTQRNQGMFLTDSDAEADEAPFVGMRGVHESLLRFVQQGAERAPWHALFFLLLLAATRYVSRHATASAPPSTRRPLATSVFIALVATRGFYPYAPAFVRDLVLLAIVVVLARVLRTNAQRRVLVFAIPFVVIDALRVLYHESSHWHRVILLLASMAGCLPLIAVLREQRRVRSGDVTRDPNVLPNGPTDWLLGRNARWVATTALVVLLVAIASNVLGYVTLAQLLSEATLATVYLGGTLAVLGRACDAFVDILLRTPLASGLRSLQSRPETVLTSFRRVLYLGCGLAWAVLSLEEFRMLEPLTELVQRASEASWRVGSVTVSVAGAGAFVLAVLVTYWSSRVVGFFLDEDVLPRMNLGRGVAPTVSMLSRYTVVGIGLVFAFAAAGVQLSSLAFIMGALGVGIGFGLQTVVNNFVSGLILIFERPVKIGDVIEVGTLVGEVTGIGIRASTVRTRQGAEVIIPNGQLISNEVVNWTASDRHRRVDVEVGVAYGTDLRRAIAALTETAQNLDDSLDFPPATTVFQGFGESSVDFSVRIWIWEHDQWPEVKTRLATAVSECLEREGIQIPFPQRVLHYADGTPREPRVSGRDTASTADEVPLAGEHAGSTPE
ncbi:MAG: mechanosensitive ion channel [Myxococcales bacterium]|nr:mechanosensitive ion channel [Myxococcales bacterium]